MPTPSISIGPRIGGGPVVQLIPCPGVTISMTMPAGTRIFDEGGTRGLEAPDRAALSIHQDGTLEYDSASAEYSLRLPAGLAEELFAAFQGKGGQALDDEIELEAEGEENPGAVEGGRRSRLKKQTRRTKGKRRNTVRR